MTLLSILRIIELTLELAVEMAKSMPPEQKAAFLQRHEQRMEFWQSLLDKVKDHNL